MKVNDHAFLGYQPGTVRMLKPRVKKRGKQFSITWRFTIKPKPPNKATP